MSTGILITPPTLREASKPDSMMKDFLHQNFRLKTDHIFDGLKADELEWLRASGVTHTYKKGEIIFRESGIPTGIYYVNAGRVKKYKATEKGGEQIFYVCGVGELLGYHALLADDRYPDSAATIEEARITFIPKDNFLQVLHNSNVLSFRLLKALGHEFNLFISTITNLGTKTVRERLALNLLILDEKFKDDNIKGPGEIRMSRTDLANMVGTAKESLVRLLQEFTKNALIEKTDKTIRVINKKGLIQEANLMGRDQKRR
jgi:CRP-like cAMP-binding protein